MVGQHFMQTTNSKLKSFKRKVKVNFVNQSIFSSLSNLLDSVHPQVGLHGQQGFVGHYPNEPLDKGSIQGITASVSHGLLGHEFEDPPGLYEKV